MAPPGPVCSIHDRTSQSRKAHQPVTRRCVAQPEPSVANAAFDAHRDDPEFGSGAARRDENAVEGSIGLVELAASDGRVEPP